MLRVPARYATRAAAAAKARERHWATLASMPAAPKSAGRWLFGPIPDLLLGCGLLYALVLGAFALNGPALRASQADFLIRLLVLLLGAPHYGATLVRVYEERESRRSYLYFAVHATLLVGAAFVAALFSPTVAALLLTVYLTWSPWHYTGQNYGLGVMFLRRAGVEVSPLAKRLLYASFLLSFAMTLLTFHGPFGATPTPESYVDSRIEFLSLGIPASVTNVLFALLLAGYVGSLAGAAVLLLRVASPRDLVPTAMLVLTQALWFTIPFAARHWQVATGVEPLDWSLRRYYFFWIGLGHAVQYLWVTAYYARASRGWKGYGRYLGKALGAGAALWTLPALLLDPRAVGTLPNTAELAVLVASAVNIHHFILDGAIWKLRSTRVGSVLIRSAPDPEARGPLAPSWGRRAVWTVATLGVVVAGFRFTHEQLLFPSALRRHDYVAAREAMNRLGWLFTISDEVRAGFEQQAAAYEGRPRRGPRRPAPPPDG